MATQTLYELAIENGDTRYLLMYCSNRCRRTILEVAQKHCAALIRLTGDQGINWLDKAAGGATMGAWRIRWTGRTQRDAASTGKLAWIGDLK
jgi:hypothetical protein